MINWQPIETSPKTQEYNGRLLVWLISGKGLLIWEGIPHAQIAFWGTGLRRSQGVSLFVQDTDGDIIDIYQKVSHWAVITPPQD